MARTHFEKARRPMQALAALVFLVVALFNDPPYAMEWKKECLEYIGFTLLILATLGRVWSSAYLGGRKTKELCTIGPFSVSRNPLYFFSLLGAMGVAMLSESVVITGAVLVIYLIYYHFVIRHEERRLLDTFGAAFDAYRRRVPRLFPNPFLFGDEESITLYTKPFRRTIIDTSLFLWVFVVLEFFEVLELWAQRDLLPAFWHLL